MLIYVIQNKDGNYFKGKFGYYCPNDYKKLWSNNISDAKVYKLISQAKSAITKWAEYPQYEIPKLVVLECVIKEVVDQEERE